MSESNKQVKIYMTSNQRDQLRKRLATLGMTQSELIRHGIDLALQAHGLEPLPDDMLAQGVRRDYIQARKG